MTKLKDLGYESEVDKMIQREIDQAFNELIKEMSDRLFGSGCAHEFKQYQGFTESYNYCTKCDHKEGSND